MLNMPNRYIYVGIDYIKAAQPLPDYLLSICIATSDNLFCKVFNIFHNESIGRLNFDI